MSKEAKRRKNESGTMPATAPPPGYLPTADPPRQNVLLLTIAALLLVLWMLVLTYLALWG